MTGKRQADGVAIHPVALHPVRYQQAYLTAGVGAAQSIGENSAGNAVRSGGVPPAAPPSPAGAHGPVDPGCANIAAGVDVEAEPWLARLGAGLQAGACGAAGGAAGCAAPAPADCAPMLQAPWNPNPGTCAGGLRTCIAAAAKWRERARWAARRADPEGFGSGDSALCSGTWGTPPGQSHTALVMQTLHSTSAGRCRAWKQALLWQSANATLGARHKHPCH